MKPEFRYWLKYNGLIITLIAVLFFGVLLTFKGVSVSTVPENKYVLEDVKYLGYEDDSCYRTSCTANFKFSDGTNTYKLVGHSHEMKTLVVDSSYDVTYDNYSKEIKSYDFPKVAEKVLE